MNNTCCIYSSFLKKSHNAHCLSRHLLNLNRPRHVISEFQFLILGKVKSLKEVEQSEASQCKDDRLKNKLFITKYLLEHAENDDDYDHLKTKFSFDCYFSQ